VRSADDGGSRDAMQSPTSSGARTLIERARAAAAERKIPATTLHVLGAALDTAGDVGRRLRARGLRALDVRQGQRTHPEPDGSLTRLETRARRIAQAAAPDDHHADLPRAALARRLPTRRRKPCAQRVVSRGQKREARPEGLSPLPTPLLFSLMMPHATGGARARAGGRRRRRDGRAGRAAVATRRCEAAGGDARGCPTPSSWRRCLGAFARGHAVVALDPIAPWLLGRETPTTCQARAPRAGSRRGASRGWAWPRPRRPAASPRATRGWSARRPHRARRAPPAQVRAVVRAQATARRRHHQVNVSDEMCPRAWSSPTATSAAARSPTGPSPPSTSPSRAPVAARGPRSALGDRATVVAELGGDAAGSASPHRPRAPAGAGDSPRAARGGPPERALARRRTCSAATPWASAAQRPVGTFLLLGPTGVGKTETAKAVAEALFPARGISRFDMAEYSEPHAVARLVGAPPGYVGYGDGGQLTEAVRGGPGSSSCSTRSRRRTATCSRRCSGCSTRAAHRRPRAHGTRLPQHGHRDDQQPRRGAFQSTRQRRGPSASARASDDGGSTPTRRSRASRRPRRAPPRALEPHRRAPGLRPLARAEVSEVARRMLRDAPRGSSAEQGVTLAWDDRVIDLAARRRRVRRPPWARARCAGRSRAWWSLPWPRPCCGVSFVGGTWRRCARATGASRSALRGALDPAGAIGGRSRTLP
jgi:DNA polymerase III delta prime subunit